MSCWKITIVTIRPYTPKPDSFAVTSFLTFKPEPYRLSTSQEEIYTFEELCHRLDHEDDISIVKHQNPALYVRLLYSISKH